MTLFLISWFTFSYSFPMTINFGVRHAIASQRSEAERIINEPAVYMAKVSLIDDGRLRPIKMVSRLGE